MFHFFEQINNFLMKKGANGMTRNMLPKQMLLDREEMEQRARNLKDSNSVEIKIINNTKQTIHTLLYQAQVELTVRNYMTAAWKQDCIAPGGTGSALLPVEVEIAGGDKFGDLSTSTKKMKAGNGKKFELFSNNGALDIEEISGNTPDGSISIYNNCEKYETVYVFKDGSPLLCAELRPAETESIILKPSIGLAIAENEVQKLFFDAATLSEKQEFDLTNQSYLSVTVSENESTGAFIFQYSYTK